LSLVFVTSIALPLAGMILGLDSAYVLAENRSLASRPALQLTRAGLAAFPPGFEAYFNDQFGFRKRLIHWLNTLKVVGLGVSPSPKVILGGNGWLFHGGMDLDFYRAARPFGQAQLDTWQRLLESRRDWLAERGVPYLVVFVPTKSTVYAEYMPRVYDKLRVESRLDQLIGHLRARSDLSILDLRGPLLAAKSRGLVYYRADTHWNNRGAYTGYTKITEALSGWFPRLGVIPISAFREQRCAEPARDLALMLAMADYYDESCDDIQLTGRKRAHEVTDNAGAGTAARVARTRQPDIVYESPDRELPRAVMFRDSFATWLIPLLSEHFRRIVFSWQYAFDRELVERERPDVVIQEMVERVLMDGYVPAQ
jgi:hypothetical protein